MDPVLRVFVSSLLFFGAPSLTIATSPGAQLSADGTLYTHPGVMSPEMKEYWKSAARRIEDCGTRHFPAQDGKRLYGKGVFIIKIDMQGRLLNIDIADSSGSKFLDTELRRIITASAPFGRPPAIVRNDSDARALKVGIVQRFSFLRDDRALPLDLPPEERCKWPTRS